MSCYQKKRIQRISGFVSPSFFVLTLLFSVSFLLAVMTCDGVRRIRALPRIARTGEPCLFKGRVNHFGNLGHISSKELGITIFL